MSVCVELIQAHTNDDHASLVLGRKNRISFTPIGDENPDGGFRLSFVANPNNFSRTPRAKTAITYVDLLCSRTLNDEEDDLLNIFTAATLSQTYPFALYKATVLGSVGCPISVDTDIDSETVEDGKVTYIDWTSASGQSVYRYSLYTLATIQTMIDVGKESKDVLEVSLGPQVMCGPENNDDVAICLHAENVIPTSVGFRSTRIVKRARATGVELQFTGSKCNDNQVFKTKLQVLCSDEEPIFHAVHVDECTIFIEARLADGCGEAIRRNTVLQGSRSPTQPRPPLPVPVTSPSEAPVEFIPRHWGPDVRHAGCVKGNCWAGEGMYVWRSGSTYEGQWLGGHRHGFGHHVWTDGRQYSGYWVDDKRSGIGNHTYATRDTYSGWSFLP